MCGVVPLNQCGYLSVELSEDLPRPSGESSRLNLPHKAAEIKYLIACTPWLKV